MRGIRYLPNIYHLQGKSAPVVYGIVLLAYHNQYKR